MGSDDIYAPNLGLDNTYNNVTNFKNLKKFKFLLKNHFNGVVLGDNAKVTIESLYIPPIVNINADTQILIRICGTNDNVFDTERGMSNSPIIYSLTTENVFLENACLKNLYKEEVLKLAEANKELQKLL